MNPRRHLDSRSKPSSERPLAFSGRGFSLTFPRPAVVMGIVNVTPDSFSDGGKYLEASAAVDHALKLVEEGAEIIDIGGESTRPGAAPVSAEEERLRVLPVIERLTDLTDVPLSIDTQKPEVARAALERGASIINDIGANRTDPTMWRLAAETEAGYVCMHMQGTPQTMQSEPTYTQVVDEVFAFFAERLRTLERVGVKRDQTLLDVGIGFGKALEHNLQLIAGLEEFTKLARPLLLGVSRKSFLGALLGLEIRDRLPPALASCCWAAAAGVQFFRAHDVGATVSALRMWEAIQASQPK